MNNTEALPPLPKPFAWMTNESAHRLAQGGNCKGAVPVHGRQSTTAKNALFLGAQMHAMYEAGYCAALSQPAASGEPADDYAEKVAFYAAFSAAEKATGHKPSHYDVWLMARGLMTVDGRAAISATQEPQP